MYIVTRKYTQQNLSAEFFISKEKSSYEFKNYFIETYVATGKSLWIDNSFSTDNLEMTVVSIWDSEESFYQFINDPICIPLINETKTYNANNGIIETIITEQN